MITLKEIVEKQKELDAYLEEQKKPRKRTVVDILGSMLAETVELEEELPYELSHKTWKRKEWNAENQFLECVDIFFFIVQLLKGKSYRQLKLTELFLNEKYIKKDSLDALINFQSEVIEKRKEVKKNGELGNLCFLLAGYCLLFNSLGYTYEQIKEGYMKKWEINMNRDDFKGNKK